MSAETSGASLPLLDRRYKRLEPLGGGASGRVYRAEDRVTGRLVAIKRFEGAAGAQGLVLRQRFWRWVRLSHPNLVSVLDFGRATDGAPVLVMELLEGMTLAGLGRSRRLGAEEAAAIVLEIARGLSYLHRQELVHGDIQPGNCMLTRDGVKLLDWDGGGLGALAYARPDRLHGAPPCPADDMFALGVLGMTLLLHLPEAPIGGLRALRTVLAESPPPGSAPLAVLLEDLVAGRIADADACIARLDAGPGSRGPAYRVEVPLVGREAVLGELAALAPEAGAVLIVGEAGVGKSRLAREILHGAGASAIVAPCLPDGCALAPWRQALRFETHVDGPLASWLAGGPAPEAEVVLEGLLAWLAGRPEGWVLLEDLHQADQASLDLFCRVAARLAGRKQGRLLATARPSPRLAGLLAYGPVRTVSLEPLEPAGSAALLAAHLGAAVAPASFAAWAHALTGGNPRHLDELAAHLTREGLIRQGPDGPSFPAEPPPASPGLQELIRGMAETLSPDARELLGWGAVLGRRFSLAQLLAATGWPEERLFSAVAALRAGRFWLQAKDELQFRHDQLMATFEEAWPPERRRRAHQVVARLLEAEGAPSGVLARHLDRAGERASAIAHYRLAGDRLAREGALTDAVGAWRRALELLEEEEAPLGDGPEAVSQARFDMWQRLGPACKNVDPVLGARVLGLARARLRAEAPASFRPRGRLSEAPDAPHVLSPPGRAPRTAWAAMAARYVFFSASEAICRLMIGDFEGSERCLAEAETWLPEGGPWLAGVIEMPRATARGFEVRLAEAGAQARRALGLMSEAPAAFDAALAPFRATGYFLQLVEALNAQARIPEALHEACLREARAAKMPMYEGLAMELRMGAAGLSGSWASFLEADAAYERTLGRSGLIWHVRAVAHARRLEGLFNQGAWERVADQAGRVPASLRGTDAESRFLAPVAMALCEHGRIEEAAAVVEAAAAHAGPWSGHALARAWLAAARGDADAEARLGAVLEAEGPGPRHHPVRCMWALRRRAELRASRGEAAAASSDLEAAEALARAQDNPLQLAINRYWQGRLGADAGGRPLAEAEAMFEALGNPHYPERIRRDRAERWWVLAEGGAAPPAEAQGVESTLRTVVQRALETAAADRGKLLLIAPGGELATRVSLSRPGLAEVEVYSRTVAQHVMRTGRSLWLADVRQDARFQDGVSLLALDLRTVICVPLRWGDRLRGLLYLDRQQAQASFTQDDFRLVEALADYGALALAHAEMAESEAAHRRRAEALLAEATALRSAEAEARTNSALAESLSRERLALSRQIVHDLRNSVQAIALMTMDLAHWAREAPEAAGSVAEINRQVAFMSDFLKQKLERLVQGEETSASCALDEVIDDLVRRFRPLCEARGQTLALSRDGTARLPLTPVELAQILGNLLDNAIKFTPAGGAVVLEAAVADGWAIMAVKDSGPGFAHAAERGAKGAGLGLGHARALAGRAGGWLSTEDGPRGAVVRIGLPTSAWGKAHS